jgi:hypothetical protein
MIKSRMGILICVILTGEGVVHAPAFPTGAEYYRLQPFTLSVAFGVFPKLTPGRGRWPPLIIVKVSIRLRRLI